MEIDLLKGVTHMKQSTVRIQDDRTIYFDPFKVEGEPKDADIIFVSHGHYDHFSIADMKKLTKKDTVLVVPEDCVKLAKEAGFSNVVAVKPGADYEVAGVKFTTVPAYNLNKGFHKKEAGWLGYIVNINNAGYYFAGDTDKIPEMEDIKADVVLLPVGGTYTMTAKEAAEAANIIKPQIAIPIHFADVVGSEKDAEDFISGLDEAITGVIIKG